MAASWSWASSLAGKEKEMKKRKGSGGGGKLLTDHVLALRTRLYNALALGLKSDGHNAKKWQCADAGIQSHALKTMAAFLSCMSHDLLRLPPIKESISDILAALEGILQSKNGAVLTLAADVSLKLVSSIGNSIRQYPMLEITISLSCLLSAEQLPIAISCATSLNCILTSLVTVRGSNHTQVWEALEKTNAVGSVVHALQTYIHDIHPVKYFMEMITLLRTIVRIWPPSRYHVWSNSELMEKLQLYCSSSETMVAAKIFKLYAALALCGNGAMNLLKNAELLVKIAELIGKSHPNNIRNEALKLCQFLVRSSEGCSLLMTSHCQPIVQGISDAMRKRSSYSKREVGDEKSLVTEGCHTAVMVLRYAGNHHSYFWAHMVDQVLYEILMGSCISSHQTQQIVSPDELLNIVSTKIVDTQPYVWDILGYLAAHCSGEYLCKRKGKNHFLEVLITCACSLAVDVMERNTSIQSSKYEQEPALRAVLMMLLSPCSYISSQARSKLSEILAPLGDAYLNILLSSLESNSTRSVTTAFDSIKVMINLMSLACLSILPQYQILIVKKNAVKILSVIIEECLRGRMHVSRSSIASHLQFCSDGRACCWDHVGEWEGENIVLFYSLLVLFNLLKATLFVCIHCGRNLDMGVVCTDCRESKTHDLIRALQRALCHSLSPGPRLHIAHLLSLFGLCGFSSKLGRKMKNALNENELADLELLLSNGESIKTHTAILSARCPNLLPRGKFLGHDEKINDGCSNEEVVMQDRRRSIYRVQMSNRVDSRAMRKILEYVYTGFVLVDNDLVKPLKMLAKYCGLKSLQDTLQKEQPRWNTDYPRYDLIAALGPAGHSFSEIILEAQSTERMTCCHSPCQLSTPHIHTHKIILIMSCDYLRALFQSGMHESFSDVIRVPLGWEALDKMVHWFYSGELPQVNLDCRWQNLSTEEQLSQLRDYVELSSLAEFWLLEGVKEASLAAVTSCLKSGVKASVEFISFAVNMGQWKMVEVSVESVAPLYPKLRDSGCLEELDEEVVNMLRSQYVQYSRHSGRSSS